MSIYDPPLQPSQTIFDPLNFLYDVPGGLTQSQADLRYLKKSGDTATGVISFSNTALSSDGSLTSAAWGFINNPNLGIYRSAAQTMDFISNGVSRLQIDTNNIISTLPIRVVNGTAGSPSINFSSSQTTGFFQSASNVIGVSTNGISRVTVADTLLTSTVNIRVPDGSASAPSLNFSSNNNLGILNSSGRLAIATNGIVNYTFATDAMRSNLPIYAPNGTATAPSYSFGGNTGIFLSAANTIGFSMAGVNYIQFSNSRAGFTIPIGCANGVQATPSLSWDNSSGFFRFALHDIRMSCNNSTKFGFNQTENTSYQNLNMNANNITSCPKVQNLAGDVTIECNTTGAGGNIILSGGTDLLSATSAGSSGQHLVLTINGTQYKIKLENI